jgi:hypothetical protein
MQMTMEEKSDDEGKKMQLNGEAGKREDLYGILKLR